MSTPKKLRSPPPRTFDNYVFTRVISPEASLFPIKSSAMKRLPKVTSNAPDPSGSNIDDSISKTTPIGFNFLFNGETYTHFVACTNGWIILRRASDTGTFSLGDYFGTSPSKTTPGRSKIVGSPTPPSPKTHRNELILPNFPTRGVLICPWFDDLKNTFLDVDDLGIPDTAPTYEDIDATDLQKQRVTRGFDFPPNSFDEVDGAMKYANVTDEAGRRCLIVRWVSMCNYWNPLAVLTFEAVIYENGTIEFRYGKTKPVDKDIPVSSDLSYESATVGIFVNDGGWHFRDMSVGLGHPSDGTRILSKYGGAVYDPAYVDRCWNGTSTFVAVYNVSMQACPTRPAAGGGSYPAFLQDRLPNWPGQDKFNSIFRMTPPLPRRKDLPKKKLIGDDSKIRLPLIARTGDTERLGTKLRAYDDRKSVNFVDGAVDYPTSLPRFHGNGEDGITDRQNLFADFDVTAAIVKSNVDQFIGNEPVSYISPFMDHSRPEQDPTANSSYFLTGSSIEDFGFSLKSSLKSKTQIKLELPINHALQMLETGSAIYYYNKNAKSLLMPQRGGNEDVDDPLKYLGVNDLSKTVALFGSWTEDARGFGPIGEIISSGTNPAPLSIYPGGPGPLAWSSDPELGIPGNGYWGIESQARVLSKEYEKSVQNNPDFFARDDEQITLPINQPFLLEKVIFEIPIKVGSGWTEDRTTSSTPIGYVYDGFYNNSNIRNFPNLKPATFDFAGPGITVSLFNQTENTFEAHRDLIVSGTIIPQGDAHKNIAVRQTWFCYDDDIAGPPNTTVSPVWLFEPEGFPSYGATPAAIISPDIDGQFTGTVVVPTVAAISNGVMLGHTVWASKNPVLGALDTSANYSDWASAVIGLMTSSTINLDYRNESSSTFFSHIRSVDPLGRNAKGFKPSGRSVFGKEFETLQAADYSQLPNPLFVSSSFNDFPIALKNVLDITTNPLFQAYFRYAVPVSVTQPSPYLIMPGDKLTLSISKMRPVIHTNGKYPGFPGPKFFGVPEFPTFDIDPWRHGLRHDVWITTGSIKMTLYGSLLREEKEFHDTLNQPLGSDAIHETLGSEPICDQHDVDYRETYYGSFSDDYITGSLVRRSGAGPGGATFITGERGRVFSKINARNQLAPDSVYGGYEVSVNPSKAFRLQPWFERVGDQRMTRMTTSGERFYDSLMPAFDECFEKDGTPIFIVTDNSDIIPVGREKQNTRFGAIILDCPADLVTSAPTEAVEALSNKVWNWSYPFEPRYAEVIRQLDLQGKKFFSNKSVDDIFTVNTITTTSYNTKIDELLILSRIPGVNFEAMCDVDLSKNASQWLQSTGSMLREDINKVMYGFGDANTMHEITLGDMTTQIVGHNHHPQFREVDKPSAYLRKFGYSPIIRGWKYGVYSALPSYSSAVFRRNKFGQFRDMLEQRLYSKYYQTEPTNDNPNTGALTSAVNVKFVDVNGNTTSPELTWSQNLSFEVTSSVPYFDGEFKNRPPIDVNALNSSIIFVNSDNNDNLII